MTTRDIVVAGALARHQMRQYLAALGVQWTATPPGEQESRFRIYNATEAQWGQIQEWVKKVTQ